MGIPREGTRAEVRSARRLGSEPTGPNPSLPHTRESECFEKTARGCPCRGRRVPSEDALCATVGTNQIVSRWLKQGRIYAPRGDGWWDRAYTHTPTVEIIDERVIRVYFAALDENKFGRVGYVDLDITDPMHLLDVGHEPVLDLGDLGTFDDSGVVPSCVIILNGVRYLYYIGFQRTERVPYMLFTGLAIWDEDSNRFSRYSRIPILDRTKQEPFSRSGPFVLNDQGVLKMWYWSCREWVRGRQGVHYLNAIRYATSPDGVAWRTQEEPCIVPLEPDEYSLGRPCVVRQGNLYRMWYSARSFSKRYLIGYAESHDGIHWERKDDVAGLNPSESGWDSEMVCYPYVIAVRGQLLMFYNGNQHGRTGFGFASHEM